MTDVDQAVPTEETTNPLPEATVNAVQRLADAIEGQRADLAEPEDDELDEEIVFVRNGFVRVTIAGKMHKLRRPFLGELADLDKSREADQEILNDKNRILREETDILLEEAQKLEDEANKEGIEPREATALNVKATQLAQKAHVASRALIRDAQAIRAEWWRQVFKVLTPPGYEPPEDMPAWIGDLALQQRIIDHWQTVPLGRGDRGGK